MEIISEMVSMEKIKPASPTPHHLRIYKTSLLDQMVPPIYIPVVLYFSGESDSDSSSSSRIEVLKESLSQTLATFYPFAGVIRDALSLDCNDAGLPFSVAKVKCQMRDFLQNPNVESINNLIPDEYDPERLVGPGANVMLFQSNCFDCGGIAMSILFTHSIADCISICTFLRNWAANARGRGELGFSELNCIAQSSFPQKPSLPMNLSAVHTLMKYMSVGKPVTRRYVFDASALSALKEELRSSSTGAAPSRVDVVTAVITKCFMAEEEEPAGTNFLITHAVDLRRRAAPPLPEGSFGNFVWLPAAVCGKRELRELVWEVKKGIARIDGEFVKRFKGGDDDDDEELYGYLEGLKNEMPKEGRWVSFTSWSNMGLYELDFGWGKPVWVSAVASYKSESESMHHNNLVMLMDRRGGDGIEAWVNIDQKYVAAFEKNYEILKYARVNPSVL